MRRRQKPFWQGTSKSQIKWQLILLVPPILTFLGLMFYIGNSFNSTDCSCANSLLLKEDNVKKLNAFLVVLIMTGPNFYENRQVIRETWLSSVSDVVLPRFVIGTANLPDDKLAELTAENEEHQDLLLLSDLEDSYYALTSKLINMYEWLDKNVEYSYVLKADDDTFVQLNLVLEELKEKKPREELYWGFFDGRAHVHYTGKWAEKDFKLCDRYLPYALGGGYVLSKDLVNFVARNSKQLQIYKAEDVALGSWISAIKVNRIHDPRFDTEYKSRGCNNAYLVTHKQSQDDMRNKHYNLKTIGKLCQTEVQTRPSYSYNWDVLPSMCCKRTEGVP